MKTAIAHGTDPNSCLAQLRAQLLTPPALVIFFASPRQDIALVSRLFQGAFPASTVIGCSTAGELSSGRMTDGAIAAMAIPTGLVPSVHAVPICDLHRPEDLTEALGRLASELGPLQELDPATHVGIVLVDGLSGAEESFMEKLGDATDIHFVGGSAGDDLAFERTNVSLDGQVYGHGAIVAILKVPNGFEIVKTQSFRTTGKRLTATAVDAATRTVQAFNGKPAAQAYADQLGISTEQLPEHFMRHPLGLMADGEPFVRSPQRITEGGSVVFYCRIAEGTELDILESTDIIADTRSALRIKCAALPSVAGIINFHCILRTLELKATNRSEEYAQLFSDLPTVGFSTYGEEYVGHVNQTATMLVLAG